MDSSCNFQESINSFSLRWARRVRTTAPPIGLVGKDDLQPGREGRRVGSVHKDAQPGWFHGGFSRL